MNIGSSAGASLSQLLSQMRARLDTGQTSAVSASTGATALTSSASATTSVSENSEYFLSQLSSQLMDSLLGAQSAQGSPHGSGADHQPPSMDDIDSDGDGSLTQSEMEAYSQSVHGDTDTARADELFARMDADGDGSVTADEKSTFDSQMAANRPERPPPGAPPAGDSQDGTADGSTSSTDLAGLMQELLSALQSYGSAQTSTVSAATSLLSVAA